MIIEPKKLLLSDKPLTRKEERRVVAAVTALCVLVTEKSKLSDLPFPTNDIDSDSGGYRLNFILHRDWVATIGYILVSDGELRLKPKELKQLGRDVTWLDDATTCHYLALIFQATAKKLMADPVSNAFQRIWTDAAEGKIPWSSVFGVGRSQRQQATERAKLRTHKKEWATCTT
jgi:hypothetical protein